MITRWDTGSPAPYGPGMVARSTDAQRALRSTWPTVGDREVVHASMHNITIRPRNASTETVVSQLMPIESAWLDVPGDEGRVCRAGRT